MPRWNREEHMSLTPEEIGHGQKLYRWRDVLDEAYRHGLIGFTIASPPTVTMVPVVRPDKLQGLEQQPLVVVAVDAHFRNEDGTEEVYCGVGDCSYENANVNVAIHGARMAETRAKARALAHALNLDANLVEEMGDNVDLLDGAPATSHRVRQQRKSSGASGKGSTSMPVKHVDESSFPAPNSGDGYVCEECGRPIGDSKNYSAGELAAKSVASTGRILCFEHRFSKS